MVKKKICNSYLNHGSLHQLLYKSVSISW